jgi:hypothetical protein
MTAFVLDVSVTMAWCFDDESSDESWQLLDRLADDTALVPSGRPKSPTCCSSLKGGGG